MLKLLVLSVFLCAAATSFAQTDSLEKSLSDSLTDLKNFGKDLDPNQQAAGNNQAKNQRQASEILPKNASLLDRMILKIKDKFEQEMKSNPFRRMSGPEIESIVLERTKGNVIGNYLSKSPRVLYFIVNFLRDEFAMHDMFQIFKKEKELKKYSYFVIGNLIFFFFLGLYYDKKSKGGFISAIFRKIFFFVLSTVVSFAVFYVIFHGELKPTVGIAHEAITKAI